MVIDKKYRKCDTEECTEVVSGKKLTCDVCLRKRNRERSIIRWREGKVEHKKIPYLGHLNQ